MAQSIKEVKTNGNFYNDPFPHFLDNFFDNQFLDKIISSFPSIDSELWDTSNDTDIEIKMRSKWESEFDIQKILLMLLE